VLPGYEKKKKKAPGLGLTSFKLSLPLQVPEWQELAVDRRKWRKVSKSIDIVYSVTGTRSWIVCAEIPR
jgi:hypothetical protein